MVTITKVPSLRTDSDLKDRLREFGYEIPVCDEGEESEILGASLTYRDSVIGNRFAILPMEGWDAEADGKPSELVKRRWLNFARSGAKLLWGCEAAAVDYQCRANPRQLVINHQTIDSIGALQRQVRAEHLKCFGRNDDLLIGLQLTHSGRWSRPEGAFDPKIVHRHDELDRRVNANESHLLRDEEIDELVDLYIDRAVLADEAGFDFVDVKHCHGYFAHELLSAVDRPGKYGGSFENRTRFLSDVVHGIKDRAPNIEIGVRFSAYDFVPFTAGANGIGEPQFDEGFRFGADTSGLEVDLTEPIRLLELIESLGIQLVCITAGSPYYNPHIQRPARYPPSDGYLPPEDPLVGVARMIQQTGKLKQRFPNMILVGSGYTYLQEWLASVGAGAVANNLVDVIGLGRMALSYPDLPADVLAGSKQKRKKICRTFSDCTTAPRQGMISGCYPLDNFYKSKPEAIQLKNFKKGLS